jgi:monoamine oxidase
MYIQFLRKPFYMTMISSAMCLFSSEQSPKVIVIGGGIAGLTAAYRLQEAGMNVDLYEARNRVGGRILSAKVNNCTAELGGHSISDGGEAFYLHRLINEFNLPLTCSRVYSSYSYFNGKELISESEMLKGFQMDSTALKSKIDFLTQTSSSVKEILEKMVTPEEPLYKVLAVRMAAYEGNTIENLSYLYSETLFHMMLGGLSSVHQRNLEGDNYVDLLSVEGGNSLLPEEIKKRLGSKIHLDMPLVKVTKKEDGSFTLIFKNGKEVNADILVIAIPCSVYKDVTFEGNLIPSERLEAMYNIQYGKNAKIVIPFEDSISKAEVLVNDAVIAYLDNKERILTLYHTGNSSRFSSETIANAYHDARAMIEMAFGENCPTINTPLYAEDKVGVSYNGPTGYSWPNDPYVKGSYSYIATGQEEMLLSTTIDKDETFKTLFTPIEDKLYFAGEHTSILFDVPGTMEAACESGERVARAILQSKPNASKSL